MAKKQMTRLICTRMTLLRFKWKRMTMTGALSFGVAVLNVMSRKQTANGSFG